MKTLSEWLRETYEVEDGEVVTVKKDGKVIETHDRGGTISRELFEEYRDWVREQ